MSWPLASFCLVAGVLAIGWLAYERSRPSARTVALVATLAALTALGRDAFAALPEVKPITAMTFVVGYALGPLPGFVVGAIGMLVSNMVLGQGPYTPWQMAAWGLVGLLGALAGRLSRRRLRRVPLALGCAFAAAIAMAVMDLYEWTVGAAHTPAAFLLIAGKALPFDAVDVGSTFLFGLLFAPELARLLARARARTEVRWEGVGAAVPAALALVVASALTAAPSHAIARQAAMTQRHASVSGRANQLKNKKNKNPNFSSPTSVSSSTSRAVAYLVSAQKADGGFGEQAGSPSAGLYTGWSAVGLAAAGRQPLSISRDGRTVLDALRAQAARLEGLGGIERTILALHACGLPGGTLSGRDLRAALAGYRKPDGSFADEGNHTAFAILAMRALGDPAETAAIRAAGGWLAAQQNADGGFGFGMRGDQSDVDDTAAVVEALLAAGDPRNGVTVTRAVAFLRRAQNPDGGFPQEGGGESNAQSTAWAVQGLLAAGANPAHRGRSPVAYLQRLQAPNGSIRYAAGVQQAPVWATAEALAALAGKPLPIAPPAPGTVAELQTATAVTEQPAGAVPAMDGASALLAQCVHVLAGLLGG